MKRKTKMMLALGLAVVMAVALIQAGSWIRPTSIAAAAYSDPVGFIKVEVRISDYTQVGFGLVAEDMALNDTDDSVTCIGEMLSDTLIGNANVANAPKIYKYLAGGGFEGALLYSDNKWYNTATYQPSTMVIDPSAGYYVQRAADGGASPQLPVVLGDVAVSDTVGVSLNTNYTMISYPYPVSVGIQDAGSIHSQDGAHMDASVADADKIYMYQAGGGFEGALLYSDNQWYNTATYQPSTMTIDVDQGVYYWRNATYGAFTWSVARPFTLP